MKILFVASEVAPFSKTGGLADVCEALPKALAKNGHHVCVVTPQYASVTLPEMVQKSPPVGLSFPFGEVEVVFKRQQSREGLDVVFVDIPEWFDRSGYYGDERGDYVDNARRFGGFSVAALKAAEFFGFTPDIVHLNDWQTGMAALELKTRFASTPLSRAKIVFTVHNLAYVGAFLPSCLDDLGLSFEHFHMDALEFHGQVSFLKAGLAFSDAVTTVSPRYAQEILTPEGGQGLDGFLRLRSADLTGILNGMDTEQWNTSTDSHLPAHFSVDDLEGKFACKKELQKRMHLPIADVPLFAVVSRLAEQKGLGLVLEVLPELLAQGAQLVVLGKGDSSLEQAWKEAQNRYPQQVAVELGFDVALSHQIEAGADFFLMPSLFEPCGLNQMYSLRYGTVPIVRRVGGLADSVVDASEQAGTGIVFDAFSVQALREAVKRAHELYADKHLLSIVQRRGMIQDFSWKKSALEYERVYQKLLSAHATPQ